MAGFFKSFFASLLAIFIAGILLIVFFFGMIAAVSKAFSSKEEVTENNSVLTIDLSKAIHEQGQSNSFASFGKGSAYDDGLYDIAKALTSARTDTRIKGLLIKLSPTPNGWATLQQLRTAIADFKSGNKFVYAYGEDIPQAAYFVATAADSVYLNPVGDLDLKGFASVLAFFKGTLDKLELQPEIYFAGKFKSATEPFRAEKISDPNRLQIQQFQAGIWNQFLMAAADFTKSDTGTIDNLAKTGAIQFPGDAYKNKLVTGLLYWDEVEQRIRQKTGQKESENIKYMSISDYKPAPGKKDTKISENRIAVVMAEGEIKDGTQKDEIGIASKTFCDELRKVRRNDKIKAVVIRVNSPGGSALASEVILRELTLLKEKKHVIISMGDYAASGGYYISSMADSIFAMPNTLTGSIGVFSMMFSTDKLMKDKLGITFDEVKNAPYADLPTGTRPLTPEEGQRMQNAVDTIYHLFKSHVAAGRKMSMELVDSIAQGRVWTGADALKLGLVDRLGGLNDAIASAAKMANVSDYKVVTYPEPADKVTALMRKFGVNSEEEAVKAAIKSEVGESYDWLEKLKQMKDMNGKAMMELPFEIKVN